MCCSGEERPADLECQRGQAAESGHRPEEGAGGSGDGAGSHADLDELDPSESEELERAAVRGPRSDQR